MAKASDRTEAKVADNAYEFVSDEEQAKSLMVSIYQHEQQHFKLTTQAAAEKAQIDAQRAALALLPAVDGFDPAAAAGGARRAQMEAERAARRG